MIKYTRKEETAPRIVPVMIVSTMNNSTEYINQHGIFFRRITIVSRDDDGFLRSNVTALVYIKTRSIRPRRKKNDSLSNHAYCKLSIRLLIYFSSAQSHCTHLITFLSELYIRSFHFTAVSKTCDNIMIYNNVLCINISSIYYLLYHMHTHMCTHNHQIIIRPMYKENSCIVNYVKRSHHQYKILVQFAWLWLFHRDKHLY